MRTTEEERVDGNPRMSAKLNEAANREKSEGERDGDMDDDDDDGDDAKK